jgi:hypothetical protein
VGSIGGARCSSEKKSLFPAVMWEFGVGDVGSGGGLGSNSRWREQSKMELMVVCLSSHSQPPTKR